MPVFLERLLVLRVSSVTVAPLGLLQLRPGCRFPRLHFLWLLIAHLRDLVFDLVLIVVALLLLGSPFGRAGSLLGQLIVVGLVVSAAACLAVPALVLAVVLARIPTGRLVLKLSLRIRSSLVLLPRVFLELLPLERCPVGLLVVQVTARVLLALELLARRELPPGCGTTVLVVAALSRVGRPVVVHPCVHLPVEVLVVREGATSDVRVSIALVQPLGAVFLAVVVAVLLAIPVIVRVFVGVIHVRLRLLMPALPSVARGVARLAALPVEVRVVVLRTPVERSLPIVEVGGCAAVLPGRGKAERLGTAPSRALEGRIGAVLGGLGSATSAGAVCIDARSGVVIAFSGVPR